MPSHHHAIQGSTHSLPVSPTDKTNTNLSTYPFVPLQAIDATQHPVYPADASSHNILGLQSLYMPTQPNAAAQGGTGGTNGGSGNRGGYDPPTSTATTSRGPSPSDYPQHTQAPFPYPMQQFQMAPMEYGQPFSSPAMYRPSPYSVAGNVSTSQTPNVNRYDYGYYHPEAAAGPSRRRESAPDFYTGGANSTEYLQRSVPFPNVMPGSDPNQSRNIPSWIPNLPNSAPNSAQQTPIQIDNSFFVQGAPPPQPRSGAVSQVNSRRSTISKSTDDELPGRKGKGTGTGTATGTHSEADVSRPTSSDGSILGKKGKSGKKSAAIPLESGDGVVPPKSSAVKTEPKDEDELEELDESKLDHRKRKRNRTIRSCVPCHNHKRKCDRRRPCGRCTALGLTGSCVYEVDEMRDMNDPNEAETDRLLRRIAELEKVVRELRQKRTPRSGVARGASGAPSSRPVSPQGEEQDTESESARRNNSKKRRILVDRFARIKLDEAALADVMAAAERAANEQPGNGRTWSSGKGAGTVPHGPLSGDQKSVETPGHKGEKYKPSMLVGEEMVENKEGRAAFLGPPAGQAHLRRLRELVSLKTSNGGHQDLISFPEDWVFTGWLPDMKKTFPFTTIWSHENFSGEIISLLPSREQSEILLESWKVDVAGLICAWHSPTLEMEFRRFFTLSSEEKRNVPLCCLSLYLIICGLGCVLRASKAEIYGDFAAGAVRNDGSFYRDSKDLTCSRLQSELYLSGSFHALRLSSFMSNPTLNGIQAQLLINIYLLHSERVPDAWTQTGSLIRQCIAMGLHIDPVALDPHISMRDAEVRRRIWWSVAGLDALFCVSFGRPSAINFYTTNLPQDRTDDNLSDSPGSAKVVLPPSNVLRNETTSMTFHAAYFQITIPSYELLDRIFRTDWKYSRSAIYGWFSRSPDSPKTSTAGPSDENTYDDAIRLANDIFQWYSYVPRDVRFEPDEDTSESYARTRDGVRTNQTLMLCMKTYMLVLVLHRPYLRADPSAYPKSSEICFKASRVLLASYAVATSAKASISWAWWTISFRAFHAGAVMAFLAIRQPGTELAKECLKQLRAAIAIFKDRVATWKNLHPVQADMCNGLLRLDRLATAATQQRPSITSDTAPDPSLLGVPSSGSEGTTPERHRSGTPLAQLQAFPNLPATSPTAFPINILPPPNYQIENKTLASVSGHHAPEVYLSPTQSISHSVPGSNTSPLVSYSQNTLQDATTGGNGLIPPQSHGHGHEMGVQPNVYVVPPEPDKMAFNHDGFGMDNYALPEMWASMFGIKFDQDGMPAGVPSQSGR